MGTADVTPTGDHSVSGVIPRIIHEVFSKITDSAGTTYRLKATYLEVVTYTEATFRQLDT